MPYAVILLTLICLNFTAPTACELMLGVVIPPEYQHIETLIYTARNKHTDSINTAYVDALEIDFFCLLETFNQGSTPSAQKELIKQRLYVIQAQLEATIAR
jgi:DNA-binding MltR family transcriptional regulator